MAPPTPTPAAAPRSGVLARTRVVSPEGCHVRAARHYPRHPRRVEGREGASAGCDVAQLPFPASLSGPPWRRPRDVVGGSPFSFLHAAAAARCAPGGQRLRGQASLPRVGLGLAQGKGLPGPFLTSWVSSLPPRVAPGPRSPHAQLLVLALGFPYSSVNLPAMQETRVRFLCREEPLEKEMATHSSSFAWRIPWTEEPGGLQSIALQSQTQLKRLSTHARSYLKEKN